MKQCSRTGVVVPSWNSLGLLPRCLGSLQGQAREPQVLVVDNGSVDGTVDYLRDAEVSHIALPRNIGFAAAVNLGVARLDVDAVLVLNADTELEPGALEALAEALDADPGLGGVQPRILQLEAGSTGDPATARLYSVGQALTRDGRAFEEAAGEPQTSHRLLAREVFGVCGAACLLRRELFGDLGGYDERYFAFYEDVDLNVRARIAGWRFRYVPEAIVWHVGNASWLAGFQRPATENARLVARNRLATQLKFLPVRLAPLVAVAETAALLRAAAQRRLAATLRGKLAVARWLPALLRERRYLSREGDPERARRWLGRKPSGEAE